MKVLFTAFDRYPAPKGAAIRIKKMLGFLSHFSEVQAVLLGDQGLPPFEQISSSLSIHRLTKPEDSFLQRTVSFAEYVLQEIIKFEPDVIQFRSLWDAYPICRYLESMPNKPLILYELHGLPEYELDFHFPDLSDHLMLKIRKQQSYVNQSVDGFICPSPIHIDYLLQQGITRQKIGFVPNGVDTELFHPVPKEDNEIPLILYLGTLAPWQGLESLLEALQWVRSPFRLQIVGSGQKRWQQDLVTRAFQLKLSRSIEVLDALPHEMIPELIQSADLCVAPLDGSRRNAVQGCMPLKILEYMAVGKAVLASDLPVTRCMIEHGRTGFLVPVDNVDALHTALENLLENPKMRKQLGAAARQQVLKNNTWNLSQVYLSQFYEKILGRPL